MLEGRVVLVTGATAGIGAAIAEHCAAMGARVLLTGRDAERGSAVCHRIVATGGEASFLAADVTQPGSAEEAIARAVARFNRIDCLVTAMRAS